MEDQDFELSEFDDINQAVDEWEDDDDREEGEAEEEPAAPAEKEGPAPKDPAELAALKRQVNGFRSEMLKERSARQEAQARYEATQKRLEEIEKIDAAIERDAKEEEEETISLADDPSAYFDHRFSGLRDEMGRKIREFQQAQEYQRAVEEHRAGLSRWQGEVLSWAQQRRDALAQEAGVESFEEVENKLIDLAVQIRQGADPDPDADPAEIRAFAQHQMVQIAADTIRAGRDPFATMVHQARAFGLLRSSPQAAQPATQKAPAASGASAARNRRAATAAPVGQGAGYSGISGAEIANMPLDERLQSTQGLDPESFFDLIAMG